MKINGSIKFKVVEVIDWEIDEHEMAGDYSHCGPGDVARQQAAEIEEKIESDKWVKENLPIELEMEIPEEIDVDDDIESRLYEFAVQHLRDTVCKYHYYKPIEVTVE